MNRPRTNKGPYGAPKDDHAWIEAEMWTNQRGSSSSTPKTRIGEFIVVALDLRH